MPIPTISWVVNKVRIIDQTKLPSSLVYLDCRDARRIWEAIKTLQVRGAPAIGIAGAFGVALGARAIKTSDARIFRESLYKVIEYLGSSRPTAVNLFWALDRMKRKLGATPKLKVNKIKEVLLKEALEILNEDRQTCRKMADFGSGLISNNDSCLTICNAGALATADYGTALGVFYRAQEKGKFFKVFACETRPLLQGSRLTAWELKKHKIDVTLIADNTYASLMIQRKIDKVFVGADRVSENGDTANKIGTFNLALMSYHHKVPFYVVSPSSTFDLRLKSGRGIPIEYRAPAEVFKLQGKQVAPRGIKAYNPAFDVTPNKFISAFITERGIIYPPFSDNIRRLLHS